MQIIIDYCKFILNRLQIWPKKVFHFSFVIFIHANSSIFMHAMVKKLCPHCQLQLGDFQLEENEHSNYVRHFSALLHFLCVVQQWVQGTFSFVMSVIFTPMLTLTNSFPSKIWLSTGLMCFDLQNEARMWNLFRQPSVHILCYPVTAGEEAAPKVYIKDYTQTSENKLEYKLSSASTWSVNIIRWSQNILGHLEIPKNHSIKNCPQMKFCILASLDKSADSWINLNFQNRVLLNSLEG